MLVLLTTALLTATPCVDPARPGTARACEERVDAAALVRSASARMDAEDWRGALTLLRTPAVKELGAATQLLEGICLYELGDDEEAERKLEAARADAEMAPSAELFLGLLAQRRGRAEEAAEAFARVASRDGSELGMAAEALLKRSKREGRLSWGLSLGAGYDANPQLTSPGEPRPEVASDAAAQASAHLGVSPWGERGPYVQARLQGRRQARLRGYDLLGAQAGAGWQLTRGSLRLDTAYGWEGLRLGGSPFMMSHQLGATLGWHPGATGVDASYSVRRDTFYPELSAGYSGTRQSAGLMLSHALGSWLVARAGYGAGMTRTSASELAYVEHGPRLGVFMPVTAAVRLSVEGRWGWREYGAATGREDTQLDGLGALEVDLATRWMMRAEFSAIHVHSNVATQSYSTLVGTFSVQYAASVL